MFLLAPLQGYTEVEFRRAWSKNFTGIHLAVSPFIPLAEGNRFRDKYLRDVLPIENTLMQVIPQVLGNSPDKFINLALRLQELGYQTINWNLGCPKRTVARKKRGSGLLPYPDQIRKILEELIPGLPIQLSIKTRLGYESAEEFYQLIKVYNDFPLESLIIHPRTGLQQYEGEMHLKMLDKTIGEIKHPITFSGDVKDLQSYTELSTRYPQINSWMIGRGVLSNPLLPEILLDKDMKTDPQELRKRLQSFHADLYNEVTTKYLRPKTTLNKMKDYWSYFALWFTDSDEIFLKLARTQDLQKFMESALTVLHEQALSPTEGRSNRQIKVGESQPSDECSL